MRCLVTGASGFLGSHMVDFLKGKGHQVITGWGDADWVFHFAAHTGGVGYMAQHEYETSVDTLQLDLKAIKWAKGIGARLFYPSSSCMYPTETGEPQGMYGYEKQFITKLSEHTPFDMRVGILGTVYGPGQKTGEKAKFPVDICQKVYQGNPIELWGDGNQVRTFLYIDDAIEMIYEVMSADHYAGPVNIASEERITVKEIADALCKHAGITPHYVFDPSKPSGAQERREDMSQWHERYSYRPKTPTTKGFERLYDWLKSSPSAKKDTPVQS